MKESNLEQDGSASAVRSHEEIIELINEIKDFETRFPDIEFEEVEIAEEFIEVEPEPFEEFTPIPIKSEIKEKDRKVKRKKHKLFRIKSRTRAEAEQWRMKRKAATFKIRFDEKGELVNLDIKKPKPKKQKSEGKKRFGLKKIRRKKGEKTEETTETKEVEEGVKKPKIKGKLGKLGKLKRAIPSRSKKKEEPEGTEKEE